MKRTTVGHVADLVRYPVKSMAGIPVQSTVVGWHGLAGDRRFAFRRVTDGGDFPWLSASRLPELLLYHPVDVKESAAGPVPKRVRTPAGTDYELGDAQLAARLSERLGEPVELMELKHGIFDEAPVSLISLSTITGIDREVGNPLDRRRFRANIVLTPETDVPFHEDEWVGHMLTFGDDGAGPVLGVTQRDLRCAMINLDPETAERNPRVLKAVGRLNDTHAGVYATVVRTGTIRIGDRVHVMQDAV